jgi:hypothetical protein
VSATAALWTLVGVAFVLHSMYTILNGGSDDDGWF